jgi:uncharacterized protein YjdB
MVCCFPLQAAVTVTVATNGTGICSNKAVTGTAPGGTALSPISVTEGLVNDFSVGTNTLVLVPPAGWQFTGALPSLTYITGSNITGISGVLSATSLTVSVTVSAISGADQFTINGLQVQPLTTSAPAGSVVASSVSGMSGISTGSGATIFASLSVAAPATASVSIVASPGGAFCPGTNVIYTPTPVNGGTPTFIWTLNGVDVSIGSTYSNNTLTSGNTVSCRMISSLGCVVASPVFSNTLTASVLPAPALITGPNNVCPGNNITQSSSTGGGVWFSTNTSVATISSSGVLTGLAAGTTTVSYVVGSCAATRTVFVNNHPFAPVLTPTVSTMCNGTSLMVSASGTPAPTTILSQNFNSGLAGWLVDTAGSINILSGSEWKACADSYVNEQGLYRSPDFSTFVMANADTSGSTSTLSTRLTSPVFSLAPYSSATLSFQHSYDYWPAGDLFVNLEISTNGGATWSPIINFVGANIGTKTAFASQSFSLNSWLGNANVRIRFNYHSSFGYYWAIDNILITGTPGVVTPTWSPVTHLFTDPSFTTPYMAGTPTNTVYVRPTTVVSPVTMVYTATATSGSCAGTATTTVSINPSPGTMSGSQNVCVGTTSTLSNTAAGGTWVSGNTAIATVGSGTGLVTGVAPGTVGITYVLGTSCTAVAIVTVNITPAPISGGSNVCLGYNTALSNATTGGTWSSDNVSIAPVNMLTGQVFGLALGTANITYSLGGGCIAVRPVTVHPLPASVTGPASVCATQTVTLSSTTTGGTWVSADTLTATVGNSTGIVTGMTAGNTGISYILTGTGCFSIRTVTVLPQASITGPPSVCVGYNMTLLNVVSGGAWLSGATGIATIHPTTGLVSGLVPGTTNITYTLPTGCAAYRVISVDPIPADVTGPSSVCIGSSVTLANVTPGGSWISNNTAIATVGSGTGVVTGVAAGSVTISYVISTGCSKIFTLTVLPVPASIIGTAAVCESGTTLLASSTGGGTWSISNANASVSGGVVSGITAGTSVVTYTIPNTCFATRLVTINPLPAPISGGLAVCQGQSNTLSSASAGGTWVSSNTVVAVIGSSSGVATGWAAGTSTITYTLPTGCAITAVFTTNTLPGSITGLSTVCTGNTTILTSSTPGGTWASSAVAQATVGSSSGVVTGVATGTTIITYTLGTGCSITRVITVNQSPTSITGTTTLCEGQLATLSCATPGGGWTTANPTIANITPSGGVMTAVSAGTTTITYMIVTGCTSVATINVLAIPAPPSGSLNVCPGTTSVLSGSPTGGTWSSSVSANITVGASTGVLTGILPGTSVITYTLPTGCANTATAVCNPLPADITGPSSVCVGASIVLNSATGGGSWVSSDVSILNLSGSIAFGVSAGTAAISYILPTGCFVTRSITVNPLPAPIAGTLNICQSASGSLSSVPTGGIWSSSNPAIVSVASGSGAMLGVTGGTATITYTLPSTCRITAVATVTPLPAAISGSSGVCVGSSILFSSGTPGGSWSSANPAIVTVSPSGIVTGVTDGVTTISYTLPIGCFVTRSVTVNPLPAPITGALGLCIGQPSVLSSSPSGGTWLSSNTSIASVTLGVASGFNVGTANISYILSTGCMRSVTVTVNLTPSSITGTSGICQGNTTLFINSVGGGTWSSSLPSVASVSTPGGVVSGIAPGTATISYTLFTGCTATRVVTINPIPGTITGPSAVCASFSITLSNPVSGGAWSSSNTSVATIAPASGVLVGVAAGSALITYMLPAGCFATTLVTVHALPASIAGNANICLGSTVTYSSATAGGTWSSSNPSVANMTGATATGLSLGTATISYTLGIGCFVIRQVTVQPLPAAIGGTFTTCPGNPVTLTNASVGGAWTSTTSAGVATVNPLSGLVTPLSPGTAIITYTLPSTCRTFVTLTVNAIPPVDGLATVCASTPVAYTHVTAGGTWQSSNTAVANVGSTTGVVVGINAGTTILSYIIPGGCVATRVITINPLPAGITGMSNVCPARTTIFFSGTPGGTWSSANTAIASVGSASGIVVGESPGVVNISYTLPTGCAAVRPISVNPFPAAVAGSASICAGSTSIYTISVTGGTWSSNNTAVCTINALTGMAGGLTPGTTAITYTPSSGCPSIKPVTVNVQPGLVTGTAVFCSAGNTTLANATPGGSWLSDNTLIATVHPATGLVSGVAAGTATISYQHSGGCFSSVIVTVNQSPDVISGVSSVCVGYNTTLVSGPVGGTWSSNNPSAATVPPGSGLVTGVGAGTATLSYSLANGCRATTVVTVSTSPAAIAGADTVCEGSSSILTDPLSGGGTWSSSNPSVATIGSATGIISGIMPGSTTISYIIGTGCISSINVTVNPLPLSITGITTACAGLSTTLANATPGGVWSSAFPSVATASAVTGIISGISPGTAVIFYTLPTSCRASAVVTVNPAPGPVTGLAAICEGSGSTMSNVVPGGIWSSSNTTVATVNPSSGSVSALVAGTTVVSYTLGAGCHATAVYTVNALPAPITGSGSLCNAATGTLSSTTSGGVWSVTGSSIAVNSFGGITALSPGIATVSYTLPTGCLASATVTVHPFAPNSGPAITCIGFSTTLSNAISGGIWSSSNTSVGTVSASGVVSGTAPGTTVVSYSLASGCVATTIVTVTGLTPVSGTSGLCVGQSVAMGSAAPGGVWSTSNTSVASAVPSTGLITGVAAGTAFVSYTYGTGCVSVLAVTVNPSAPVAGPSAICVGQDVILSNAISGGTWGTASSFVSVNASTGLVTGLTPGPSIINYTLPTGCVTTHAITVNPLVPVTGPATVCEGASIALSNVVPGGTWTTSDPSVATVSSASGVATGVSAGSAIISYTNPSGCVATYIITVNGLPAGVTGSTAVCEAATTTWGSTTTGGTWTSSDPAVATIAPATGLLSGITAGTTLVTYTLSTGCASSYLVTVHPLPASVTGSSAVCVGATAILTSATAGGSWYSSNGTVANASIATGIITGVAAGTTLISYMLPTGCIATRLITVDPLPATPVVASGLCVGASTLLTSVTTGGTWLATGSATIDVVSGIATGTTAGSAVFTYTLPTGCSSMLLATVSAPPATITGPSQVCAGASVTLANTTLSGSWAANPVAVATVDAVTGVVTGSTAGTVHISYVLSTGCAAYYVVNVHPLPAAITGADGVCVAATSAFTSTTPGGTWVSANSAIAAVSATGVVTGVTAGVTLISYTLPTGCAVTKVQTIYPLPALISGSGQVCAGQSVSLTNSTTGGIWVSGVTPIATVDAMSGVVNGIAPGIVGITYILSTGCQRTTSVTVNVTPLPISGAAQVCAGASISLTNSTAGGIWSTSAAGIALVGTSGILTGVAAGTANISYSLPGTGCRAVRLVTVNPLPPAIGGITSLCPGNTVTLTNTVVGGSWSVSGTAATLDAATGIVTGAAPGFVVVSYTLPTGCFTASSIVVNSLPATISGATGVCVGANTTLTNATLGGAWVSSSPSVAAVSYTGGVVTGISAGVAYISYIIGTGCYVTHALTVNPLPSAIGGATSLCLGVPTALTNAIPGGTWASSNVAIVSVDGITGVATGHTVAGAVITYTLPTGCSTFAPVYVNPVPSPISGSLSVCMSAFTSLGNTTPGGTWHSSNTAVATVDASGVVTGVAAGTVGISYTVPTGCSAIAIVTVQALMPISGPASICGGVTATFTNPVPGGVWSGGGLGIFTVSAGGVVTGIAGGVGVVSYVLPSGCVAARALTINQLPASYYVTGGGVICAGSPGVPIGLTGSETGVRYTLYNGSSAVTLQSGTGTAFGFGTFAIGGLYTVQATNIATGCVRSMAAAAVVTAIAPAPAGVVISSTIGDTVCAGTGALFTAIPTLGGSAPTYEWRLNGIVVGTDTSYTLTPVNGDELTCRITSNSPCAVPPTATSVRRFTVLPIVTPVVSIAAMPVGSVCATVPVTFTPSATHAGSLPLYLWEVNGVVAGTGATYTYTPANTDVVNCRLVSNALCRSVDTVTSAAAVMSVTPRLVPQVTVNATPGWLIVPGSTINFNVVTANAGTAPTYQWKIDGTAITGATNSTFVWSVFAGNEKISCDVTSNGDCGDYTSADTGIVMLATGIDATTEEGSVTLFPNPNSGSFVVSGIAEDVDGACIVRVVNVLGQQVYSEQLPVVNGTIRVSPADRHKWVPGTYSVVIQSGNGSKMAFHIVVRQ